MIQSTKQQQVLTCISPLIPIKHPQQIQCLHMLCPNHILIAYQSSIHIHSIDKITMSLPSLISVIDIQAISNTIQTQYYQDKLTSLIVGVDKKEFGSAVFGNNVEAGKNRFLQVGMMEGRIRFLGAQSVRISAVCVHRQGHILVSLHDSRCIVLLRKQGEQPQYDTQHPIILNKSVKAGIVQSTFTNNKQPTIICLHKRNSKSNSLMLSSLSINEKNEVHVQNIKQSKKQSIDIKGIHKIQYIPTATNNFILLLYSHHLQLLQISTNNPPQILSHKQADITQQLQNQYIIKSWCYRKSQSIYKIQLLTITHIYTVNITFSTQQKSTCPWTYSIQKYCQHQVKSNVYLIMESGKFLEEAAEGGVNVGSKFVYGCQTWNGFVVRVGSCWGNYREGVLGLYLISAAHVLNKIITNFTNKQKSITPSISLSDLQSLKSNIQFRKQFLKQLNELKQDKNKIQPHILNRVLLNIQTIMEIKPQSTKQIFIQLIKAKYPQREFQDGGSGGVGDFGGRCALSNRVIMGEDVCFCQRCGLYFIRGELGEERVCYVCWNRLVELN